MIVVLLCPLQVVHKMKAYMKGHVGPGMLAPELIRAYTKSRHLS